METAKKLFVSRETADRMVATREILQRVKTKQSAGDLPNFPLADWTTVDDYMQLLCDAGLIKKTDSKYHITWKGLCFLDSVATCDELAKEYADDAPVLLFAKLTAFTFH